MSSQPNIQDILQAEFSPPLDTSLIAAIVADYDSSGVDLRQLRSVLGKLAADAEKELVFSEEPSPTAFSQPQISSPSIGHDSSSSYDLSTTDNSGYVSTSSATSDAYGQQPFSSPLGFLRAVFPQISLEKLRNTIAAHGGRIDDLDMESLVEELLTSEYVRELEERGLDESESREMGFAIEAPWELVDRKKKVSPKQKKQNKGTTFTLVDVRQQQHARPASSTSRPAPPDPWTQLASVASHLATLVPSQTQEYFQSVFHSPNSPTPAHALRAAMVQIARKVSGDELTEEESPLLFAMFEILTVSPMYAGLNIEERDQLLEDALFALRATDGKPDTALDLVELLVELDADFSSKEYAWGVYHKPSKPHPKVTIQLPNSPPPIPPPPNVNWHSQTIPGASAPDKSPASPDAWKTVPLRPVPDGPHPLAGVIRAYNKQTSPTARKVRGAGDSLGQGGKGDVYKLPTTRTGAKSRAWELLEQRRAALREAGKAWQKGNARNHGGQIAFYFAERARELQQKAQEEQLDAARDMVMRSQKTSLNTQVIDLHGTIVVEAIAISREYLADHWTGKPVRIVTGRGTHSRNGVGILGPAVKNALTSDGWIVEPLDGCLLVRGLAR